MKLQYKEIDVVLKDRANVARIRVPAWEVPVVEAVHGEGNVAVVRDIVEDRPTPSSDAEFDRLTAVYGEGSDDNGNKGLPFVATVYGSLAAGRRALREAMQSSVLPADTEVTPFVNPQLNESLRASLLVDVPADNAASELIA